MAIHDSFLMEIKKIAENNVILKVKTKEHEVVNDVLP